MCPPHPEIRNAAHTMHAQAAQGPSPEVLRSEFPDTPPTFEEFWQTLSSGRSVEEDRAQAAQLAAGVEASAAQEQATLQAAASAQKAEIQGLADAQSAVIETALAQQTAALRDSHATARDTLRASAEQRKADMARRPCASASWPMTRPTRGVSRIKESGRPRWASRPSGRAWCRSRSGAAPTLARSSWRRRTGLGCEASGQSIEHRR